jgi:hypothetical protein
MRMMNNFPQVRILKVVKMIMSMVDNFFQVGNLKALMVKMMFFLQVEILEAKMMVLLMMKTFLLENSLVTFIVLRVIMIFIQVNIFM